MPKGESRAPLQVQKLGEVPAGKAQALRGLERDAGAMAIDLDSSNTIKHSAAGARWDSGLLEYGLGPGYYKYKEIERPRAF